MRQAVVCTNLTHKLHHTAYITQEATVAEFVNGVCDLSESLKALDLNELKVRGERPCVHACVCLCVCPCLRVCVCVCVCVCVRTRV
jgi:hypothetical protein